MSNLAKFVAGIVIAVVAGLGNYAWLNSVQNQQPLFLRTAEQIAAGTTIQSGMLEAVRVPGLKDDLKKTFVPIESQPLIVGMPAVRTYGLGEMLLQADISDSLPRWRALGPFRLLSVGERIRSGSSYTDGSGGNTVTIAAFVDADGRYDKKSERLLDIIASQSKTERIVAIQLEPSDDVSSASTSSSFDPILSEDFSEETPLMLEKNERGIIVPLRNVVSIPEVLVRGSKISFVISWFDE